MAPLEEENTTVKESINLQDMQLDEKKPPKKVPGFWSVRYGLAIIIHFCLFVTTSQNLSLSIAIVAMVNSTGQSNQTNVSTKGQPDVTPEAGYQREKSIDVNLILFFLGGIGCICCVIWFSLVYDDPINHPYISESEKEYITFSLAGENSNPSWSLPIKAMIRSLPLWAIIITGFCRFWLVTNLTISLPLLINIMFDFDIRNNGILSALPSIAAWICITIGSQMADFLLSKKILSLVVVRKLFTVLGMLLPSVFITAVPYVSSITAITLLMLSMGISCLCYSGFMINSLDIAPRYTSFLMGLGGVFTILPGIISPIVTGYLINKDSVSGWKNVFLLSAAINLAGMIIYVIFGRADIQDWAKEKTLTRF
ncbi:sodium-dependent phosphate transport protein 3-like [Gracilinanus agilis]|uniref:sodium-dependent phosphate transport protein 3-like n=1 Tax=Gracilinanus agilis TaxID=191870 RepID=UPI001CFDAD72|nr:sodium-dependent phosphate transport protein 3-like [Gracilinanus agilis]